MTENIEEKSEQETTESQGNVSASPDRPVIFIINRFDSIIIDINTWFEKKLGLKKEFVLGKTLTETGLLPDKETIDLIISLQHPYPYGRSSNITFHIPGGRVMK